MTWTVGLGSWQMAVVALAFVASGMLGGVFGAQIQLRGLRSTAHRLTSIASDPGTTNRRLQLKSALENLWNPDTLRRSPLMRHPALCNPDASGAELRELLVDVVIDLAASPAPRDQEAGRLLLDYYVKRVGSHEVVMERLCLSRPTFYRRLQRGLELVTGRLDSMSESSRRSTQAVA